MRILTSFLFHVPALESLVEQADSETNINTHAFLIDLARDPVLDKDIGRIGSEFVSTVRNLGNDLGVPFALGLAGGHKAAHNEVVDLAPVTAGTCGNMGDDIRIRSFAKARLVA